MRALYKNYKFFRHRSVSEQQIVSDLQIYCKYNLQRIICILVINLTNVIFIALRLIVYSAYKYHVVSYQS